MPQGFRHAYGLLRRKAEAYDVLVKALQDIVTVDESFGGKHQYADIARVALKKAGGHAPGAFDAGVKR